MIENKMLLDVMTHCFRNTDLNLYLDTHPEDQNALELYKENCKKLKELTKDYESKYGPIMAKNTSGDTWDYIKNPWPWDKEINKGDENICGNMKRN